VKAVWLVFVWLLSTAGEATASDALSFRFHYTVILPSLAAGERGELWIPIAETDDFQTVIMSVEGAKGVFTSEPVFKNRFYHVKFGHADQSKTVNFRYQVTRREKKAFANREAELTAYLRAEKLSPLNGRFRQIAEKVTRGKRTDLEKSRALYDYVLSTMKYDKSGTGWGRGDAVYACDVKTGNCTDFHALFLVLARSLKIPARFAVGFTIPTDKPEGAIEGYHCWAEFLANGNWVPIDISEAWKERNDPKRVDYYFGHHPANRLEMSRGRELEPEIRTQDGPINFLVHPYLEVNGKAQKFQGKYEFSVGSRR